jgi:hypothetical protein
VTEDPKETDDDCLWAYAHDRWGTFRGRKEWRALFSAIGFSLIYEKDLDCEPHSRHFFFLRRTNRLKLLAEAVKFEAE